MANLTYANTDYELANGYSKKPGDDMHYCVAKDHHAYALPNKGVEPLAVQRFTFIHLDENGNYSAGITDEQLLEVLIDRTEYFQSVLPCEENVATLTHLRAALQAKLDRTAKRQAVGVEGTHQAH